MCSTEKLSIKTQKTIHLAYGLSLHCSKYYNLHHNLRLKVRRLALKLSNIAPVVKNRKQRHAVSDEIRYIFLKKCENMKMNSQIGLRCMLATYHLGTGPQDITKLCSMLGLDNMLWFERSFTQHESKLNDGLITVTRTMIKEALMNETISTAKSKPYDTINETDLNKFLHHTKTQQFEHARRTIRQIKLTASFDMG